MNERSGTLFSWSTAEFGCWVLILLFPVLCWVHGPAVSPDQWFVRTALVVVAVGGAVGARLVRRHRTGRVRWRVSWGLQAALGVALALRVPYLTQRSIWYDEASSWQTASFGVGGVIDSLRLNVHLPLYYWLLQRWTTLLGESVLALRSLSVALGLASVAGMYLAAREWLRWSGQHESDAGSRLPATVALLVAVNAFQINAAIEVRMYALAVLVLGMSVATIDFWRNRQIPSRPGMAGAVERLMALHNGRDPIVATSNIHYFPAKYYLRDAATVRILRSATEQFWGSHLIRPHDVVSDEQFHRWLEDGVWLLSHSPPPSGVDTLRDAVVEQHFAFRYDAGIPPWTVHVSYVRVLGEEARLAAAIEQVRSGAVTHLDLSRLAAVEDALRQLAGLERLSLWKGFITDAGCGHLGQMSALTHLSLDETQVTDAGLRELYRLKNLRRISLWKSRVTDRGVANLQKALPDLEINR